MLSMVWLAFADSSPMSSPVELQNNLPSRNPLKQEMVTVMECSKKNGTKLAAFPYVRKKVGKKEVITFEDPLPRDDVGAQKNSFNVWHTEEHTLEEKDVE